MSVWICSSRRRLCSKKRGSRSRKILSKDGMISCRNIKICRRHKSCRVHRTKRGKCDGESERVIEERHAQLEELGQTNPEDIRDGSGAG